MLWRRRFVTRTNYLVLAASLGFSSGVMLYVSFEEIFQKSLLSFEACNCLWSSQAPPDAAYVAATLSFFGSVAFVFVLDSIVHFILAR